MKVYTVKVGDVDGDRYSGFYLELPAPYKAGLCLYADRECAEMMASDYNDDAPEGPRAVVVEVEIQ
jgi:hypothetical protein